MRVLEEMGVDVPDHVPRQLERAIVRSEGSDLIVVASKDGLLVADRARAENIKKLVDGLPQELR